MEVLLSRPVRPQQGVVEVVQQWGAVEVPSFLLFRAPV